MADSAEIHLFRPNPNPSVDIPLGARSIGYYDMDKGIAESWQSHGIVKIFWCVSGAGELVFGKTKKAIHADEIAVYMPYALHQIRAVERWNYWWWTMDGPMAASIIEGFGLGEGVFPAGTVPVGMFKKLQNSLADFTRRGERMASAIAYNLLSLAAIPQKQSGDKLVEQALDLIKLRWHEPEFGVDAMASALNTNRSTLTRRFDKETGLSPIRYLSNHRMLKALEMLRQTDEPIEQIAFSCGFSSGNYFARMIKKVTGLTPSQYREGSSG